MIARVGLCVDSNAQLPNTLADRVPTEVVPVTLHLDDGDYLDVVDLSAERWHELAASRDARLEMTAPSSGQYAIAVENLVARGCTAVLSLHGVPMSCADASVPSCAGSGRAARLAAHRIDAPMRVLEVSTAGVGVGCCAWVAAEALLAGADLDTTVAVVEATVPRLRHLVLAAPVGQFVRGSVGSGEPPFVVTSARADVAESIEMGPVATVATILDAVNAMAADIVFPGVRVRVLIGHGDAAVEPVAAALAAAIGETAVVEDVRRYRVGPMATQLTGTGVVRCEVIPADAFAPC